MVKYIDEMGTASATAVTYTAMTGSPYSPLKNGKLTAVRVTMAGQAVTSLMEELSVRLTCPDWGVPVIVKIGGGALRTAPAVPIPTAEVDVDLPVSQASKITLEYKFNVTAVTPQVSVCGVFEA